MASSSPWQRGMQLRYPIRTRTQRTQTVFTWCCNARKNTLQNTMGHSRDCVSDERAGTRGQRRSPASGECVRFTRSRPVCRARVGKASESEKSGQRCPDFYLEARVRCPKGTIALPLARRYSTRVELYTRSTHCKHNSSRAVALELQEGSPSLFL